jgi:hypothetical protein
MARIRTDDEPDFPINLDQEWQLREVGSSSIAVRHHHGPMLVHALIVREHLTFGMRAVMAQLGLTMFGALWH